MALLYQGSFMVFLVMTIIGGGGAAYMAGRALAIGWKPKLLLLAYMAIFGLGLRFLHFALFAETLLSIYYYVVQTAIVMGFALLGYQMTRANQMSEKYPWLYEKSGPLSWRDKN